MVLSTQELEWGQENNMNNDQNKFNDFNNPDVEVKLTKDDFQFMQMDEKIHDVKFETKPTTFFKDALKRFAKNKSSVTAGVIIGILITMSILVPIASQSNINQSFPEFRYLPPRWPGMDGINGLNGTKNYSDILLNMADPENPVPAPDIDTGTTYFYDDAIVSEVKATPAYYSTPNAYGFEGTVVLRTDKRDKDASLISPLVMLSIYNDYEFTLTFDEKTLEFDTLPSYAIYLDVAYISGDPYTEILVKDFSNTEADLIEYTMTNIGDLLETNRPVAVQFVPAFDARFRIVLETTPVEINSGRYSALFMNSFTGTSSDEDDTSLVDSGVVWTSGNELLLRDKVLTATNRWRLFSPVIDQVTGETLYSGAKTVVDVKVFLGSFVYNEYIEVFGNRVQRIGKTDFETKYMNPSNPRVSYDFNVGVDSFQIIDDKVEVVRVVQQYTRTIAGKTVIELDIEVSLYKFYGFSEMPYYLFGTNQRGHDFFKVLFSGLNTSLILGLTVAAINIFIGIVWGAISGYYGGTIDLVMERFTEILSGVPSIVVFTLTILTLGNSFGVFVMAMILTGWIGVAARTRSQFYRYKRREYVMASRTLGASDARIIFRHILPNSVGPLITSGVLMIPGIIFTEASISYLNLGLQGLPSFGVAMSEVQGAIHTDSYLILAAAIIVSMIMVSFNLFGNGLRDAFNPSLKGVE
jgi:ABC-type dipeptide/oligopeptide/nickel transport system permease subunit